MKVICISASICSQKKCPHKELHEQKEECITSDTICSKTGRSHLCLTEEAIKTGKLFGQLMEPPAEGGGM